MTLGVGLFERSRLVRLALVGMLIAPAGGCAATTATPGPSNTPAGAPTAPRAAAETGWLVVRVIDGDTIQVSRDGQRVRVRMAGIDTPETVKANTPLQCDGPEASHETHALLDGKRVVLESDPTQPTYDQYGRRLAHVWTATAAGQPDLQVNWYLVRQGFAHARTYGVRTDYQDAYDAAQRAAKAQHLGFWSPATCNGDTRKPA